jgi:hypothetical protein
VAGPDRALVGTTVTVTPGTWTGEDATSTVTYQWLRWVGLTDRAHSRRDRDVLHDEDTAPEPAARQILVTPNCELPPDDSNPF